MGASLAVVGEWIGGLGAAEGGAAAAGAGLTAGESAGILGAFDAAGAGFAADAAGLAGVGGGGFGAGLAGFGALDAGALSGGLGALGGADWGSALAGLGAGGAASGGGGGGLLSGWGAKDYLSAGSNLYGLSMANKIRKQSDPFAKYRAGYGAQLQALEQNPASLTTRPGYQAGLQAVQRGSAAGGYLGSGNEMAALAKYGGDFYGNEVNRLAGLAGAGATPGAGSVAAANLAGQALAGFGYTPPKRGG